MQQTKEAGPPASAGPDGRAGTDGVAGTGSLPAVLVVIGVSGSGKTTIASELARRLEWTFEDADWFHPKANVEKMSAGTPLTDQDRWPWLFAIADWIEATRVAGRHGIVACSALKREYRAVLVGAHPEAVRLVYLDGDRKLIGTRMSKRRGHFMPAGLLDSQFEALEPPGEDENPIRVSIAPKPGRVVDAILSALGREDLAAAPEAGARHD